MGARHARRWEQVRAMIEQSDRGEWPMTVRAYDRARRELDRIERSGRADEYPAGQDPRRRWRR
jgi:hypothetical protein